MRSSRLRSLGRILAGLLVATSPMGALALAPRTSRSPEVGPAPTTAVLRQRRRSRKRRHVAGAELTYLADPPDLSGGVGPIIGTVPMPTQS